MFGKKSEKESEKRTIHNYYPDKKFFEAIKIVELQNFDEEELLILVGLLAVPFFRGDMKKLKEFMVKKESELKVYRMEDD